MQTCVGRSFISSPYLFRIIVRVEPGQAVQRRRGGTSFSLVKGAAMSDGGETCCNAKCPCDGDAFWRADKSCRLRPHSWHLHLEPMWEAAVPEDELPLSVP